METIELSISDHSQLRPLHDFLLHTARDADVRRMAEKPALGTQGGALDWVELAANSTTLIAVLKLLPEFLRSRRAGTTIVAEKGEGPDRRKIKIPADIKAEQIDRLLEWFLDE